MLKAILCLRVTKLCCLHSQRNNGTNSAPFLPAWVLSVRSIPPHETYLEMTIGAIKYLRAATALRSHRNVMEIAFKKHCLSAALKKGVKSGMLVKVKAPYKLGEKVHKGRFESAVNLLCV